jgi:hypothetical protein
LCFAVWSLADLRHADVLPGISERTAKTAIATVHGTEKKAATKKATLPTRRGVAGSLSVIGQSPTISGSGGGGE